MELQLIEFLIDTVEALLHIVRQQNSQLSQLGAVAAEEQLQDIEAAYSAVLKMTVGRRWTRKMWIDVDTIIKAAALVTALGVLGGVAVSLYRASERDRKQSEIIKEVMAEQSLICYGLRGALQGLIEQGCNGPCKDALEKLNKHLNQEAHHNDL